MSPNSKNLGENHETDQHTGPDRDYQTQYEDNKTEALLFRTDQQVGEGQYGGYSYNPGK